MGCKRLSIPNFAVQPLTFVNRYVILPNILLGIWLIIRYLNHVDKMAPGHYWCIIKLYVKGIPLVKVTYKLSRIRNKESTDNG